MLFHALRYKFISKNCYKSYLVYGNKTMRDQHSEKSGHRNRYPWIMESFFFLNRKRLTDLKLEKLIYG